MVFSRSRFFLSFFSISILPFPLYKLIWLAASAETTGTFYFVGHGNLGSVLGISTYPVIRFKTGGHTIYFNSDVNIPLKENEKISVRYQRNDPEDAKINEFSSIWGDTIAYSLGPVLVFLIVFFHPDLIPKKSRIVLGRRPLLKFIESD